MVELSMPIQTDDSGFAFVLKDDGAIKLLRLREDQRGPLSQEYNIIDKDDLYSNDPREVFGGDHIWHTRKTTKGGVTTETTYVFAKLTKLGSPNSQRYSRVSGEGSWHQENTSKNRILADSGGAFGVMIALSFIIHGARIGWNMHEYSLRREPPPNSPPGTGNLYVSDRVLCKITRRVRDSPQEQSSSTVIDNNNPANKRAAEEVVPPAVQACSSSSNKMQKVSVVGSVPPTLTSIASSSNKENSTAESDAELMEYMENLPDLIPGFHRLNFEA